MQLPTHTNIRIRSTLDAHIIFHAVSLNMLPIIHRRLDADERAQLQSGCIYAWEERGQHTEVTGLGIERFTEGRRWGPSRVRDEFLFYYEKCPPNQQRDKENPLLAEMRQREWDPLVKQTYSVWVDGPKGRRKWHLTAYFTQATVDQLQTIDDIPHLANLEVPHGKYISTRLGKPRNGRTDDSQSADSVHDIFRSANASVSRTYAPFPLPYEVTPPAHQQPNPPPPPLVGYEYPRTEFNEESKHPQAASVPQHSRYSDGPNALPPLHTLSIPGAGPSDRRYAERPLTHAYPAHHNESNGHYNTGRAPVQYSDSGHHAQGQSVHAPAPNAYYPPTPTSVGSHYNSPVYPPTPGSMAPHHHHVGSYYSTAPGSADVSMHEQSYPGSHYASQQHYPHYPQAPSKYSEMPVTHGIPDPRAASYTQQHFVRDRHSPTDVHVREAPREGQNGVRRTLSPSIDPTLQQSGVGAVRYTGIPAAAPRDGSASPPHRTRPSVTISSHSNSSSRLSPPLSETRDDRDDLSGHSPSLSPRSTTSSLGSSKRLDLAPLRTLVRPHPYRRDKFDDRALMAFSGGRRNSYD